MPDLPDQSFTLPTLYQPRIPWRALAFTAMALTVLAMFATSRAPGDQIPLQYVWEGPVSRWVPRDALTQILPGLYGLLAAVLCLVLAMRLQPDAPGRIQPPTPYEGFSDHLSRAISASLLEVNAIHFAYIGMIMQWTTLQAMQQALQTAVTPGILNIWVVPGYLFYLGYCGWLLLIFNRDAKRGQYGDRALDAAELVPPAVPHPPRAGKRRPPRPAVQREAQRSSIVE